MNIIIFVYIVLLLEYTCFSLCYRNMLIIFTLLLLGFLLVFVLFVETGFFCDCGPGCPGTCFLDQAGLELRGPTASVS